MDPILIYCRIFPLAGAVTYHSLGYVGQVVGYAVCRMRGGWSIQTNKKLPSHRCGTTLLANISKVRLIFSDMQSYLLSSIIIGYLFPLGHSFVYPSLSDEYG
jgi:hypothetical protein